MKKHIFLFSFIFLCFLLQAQNPEAKRANHWYFGNAAGLDFSSGSPVAVTNSAMQDDKEGNSSISDLSGNLLFYTDGDTVWDKNHNPMPNGKGLSLSANCGGNGNSSLQGALIVPHPGNPNLYYLFTTDCAENFGADGYRYNLIDMTLNGGNGDVAVKRQLLFAPCTEMQTATINANGNDYWVVTHEAANNKFRSYKIDNTGLNMTPTISSAGFNLYETVGSIKISPNGKFLSMGPEYYDNSISFYANELFFFNNSTGLIDHFCFVPSIGGSYFTSFSPDNSKVYFASSGYVVYQFNLCLKDTLLIQQSFDTVSLGIDNSTFLGFELANDGKLYISSDFYPSISVINQPNELAVNADLVINAVPLAGKISREELPNFMAYYFNQPEITCEDHLTIPNVFSPNNDGINDYFSIEISGYEKINYTIYNRWGNEIKNEELPIKNAGVIKLWDGNIKGNKASDGVYYYIINFFKKGGEIKTEKGFVHLFN